MKRIATTTVVRVISSNVRVVTVYRASLYVMVIRIVATYQTNRTVPLVFPVANFVPSLSSNATTRFACAMTSFATATMTVATDPMRWNQCARTSSAIKLASSNV